MRKSLITNIPTAASERRHDVERAPVSEDLLCISQSQVLYVARKDAVTKKWHDGNGFVAHSIVAYAVVNMPKGEGK